MILAVSKGQTAAAIETAYRAGLRNFGENYVDEAAEKMRTLSHLDICWHFIGRIQSNKTKVIAENFSWVHTIDRPRIAERLSRQRPRPAPALNALIQVNLAGERQKGGISVASLPALVERVDSLPQLNLRGLMTLPPADLHGQDLRTHFLRIRDLAVQHSRPDRPLDVLSMGMSDDYELAIECGSTCVRVGTALFGPRGRAVS
jgi:pyridoxal phosphate enzyme (YggS family)